MDPVQHFAYRASIYGSEGEEENEVLFASLSVYGAGKTCPHSSMDRVVACGAIDEGSTPSGDT